MSWRVNGHSVEEAGDARVSIQNYAYIRQLKIVNVSGVLGIRIRGNWIGSGSGDGGGSSRFLAHPNPSSSSTSIILFVPPPQVVPSDSNMRVQIMLEGQTHESVLTVEEIPVEFAEKLPRKSKLSPY